MEKIFEKYIITNEIIVDRDKVTTEQEKQINVRVPYRAYFDLKNILAKYVKTKAIVYTNIFGIVTIDCTDKLEYALFRKEALSNAVIKRQIEVKNIIL